MQFALIYAATRMRPKLDQMAKADHSTLAEHGSKAVQIAAEVSRAIHSGRFVPGQRLIEHDITRDLGVSRSLLREAFRTLSAEGVIEIVPNRGATVRRLCLREVEELFAIRMELEALAARLAAARCNEPVVRTKFATDIKDIHLDHPRNSTQNYLVENQHFHAAIFQAAGNTELQKLNRLLQLSLMMAQISSLLTAEVLRASMTEHRAIAAAVLDRDPSAADAAIRSHLARACDFVRAAPADIFRRD